MKKRNIKQLAYTLLLIALLISVTGCNGSAITEEPTSIPTEVALLATEPGPTSTPRPTPTPTEAPLGQAANPIIMGFVLKPEQTDAIDAAQEIVSLIESDTNLALKSAIYPDFLSLSTAILNGDVHLFWLDPLEYLYLNSQGAADVMLVTNHLGVYAYGVRFLAKTNRGFTSFYDADLDESYGDTLAALQQFAGTRPCFINDQSLPGYFVPLGLLNNTSTPTLDPVFVYDYSAVIRALYIGGICDFGVSYALIGDARTASDVQWDLPDAESMVGVVWQSEGIIPNLNLSVSPQLPLTLQVQLQEAVLDLADAPEELVRLSSALNYDIGALKVESDSFYTALRSFLGLLGLDYQSLTQYK
ncbi:PhnD/SsuA/transferrin family substrate-binding protein [Chloroflexota bacterium]|nr:PhnD/SsuA/transferrin family substrate-binding protein [Chloroflexota bacterium]